MNVRIIKFSILAFIIIIIASTACQKLDRPELKQLILDTIPEAPPYNPVKSFFAFENNAGDSGETKTPTVSKNITYVTGVNGMAAKIDSGGYIVETSVSDSIKNLGSFTIAFWMNGPGPVVGGAQGLFAISNKNQFWGNLEMFLENNDNGSEAFLKIHLFNMNDTDGVGERWNEIKLAGALNKWTHVAVTYDSATSMLSLYIDGAITSLNKQLYDLAHSGIKFKDVNGMVVGTYQFQTDPSLTNHGPEDWARSFKGSLDQFRLYKIALTATEVNALYTSKE